MKKNILFIINPISGGKNKRDFPLMAKAHLDMRKYNSEFIYTNYPRHAYDLAQKAVKENIDVVVAVGGDGTINEVGSAIMGTDTKMGIVPCGSGNGLARALGIPLSWKKAVMRLNEFRSRRIDTGILNEFRFFNMAGLGFDAHISNEFAALKGRGLTGYVKKAFSEVLNYKPGQYTLEIDGKTLEREAFMISFANSSQYGNDAHIAPKALLDDGILDICIIKPFPLYLFISMGLRMFAKTSEQSKYVEIIKGESVRIESVTNSLVHIDGEAKMIEKEICISIDPLSLCVLY
ncbi:YegS/Rv2252/BmrU family lipid kinase [Arcticibacter pallidicorallinus]|uniref:YegS/Rv2252/BmrU family lipid kinase n=1 Tax=Arcticibacter pallidicorallinus TaxID=1259464 RepID=A0A2T0TTZ3_9SPHI|nr:diacylglycerol kinase family protein [Arcticibacter pallidicorallinus]PRY49174.1 YegS/Rv2252/BmrU family lipid kinase [Arcticibacter pallidicorallinus]